MRSTKHSDGFSVIHTLLVIIVVVVVGFTGWYIYQQNNTDSSTQKASDQTKANTSASQSKASGILLDKTFTMERNAFTFKYPSNWDNLAAAGDSTAYARLMPQTLKEKYATDTRLQSQGLMSVSATYYTGSPQDFINSLAAKRKLEYQAVALPSSKVGYSAYKGSEMTNGLPGKKYTGREYDIFHNGTLIQITVFTSIPGANGASITLSEYNPVVTEIIKSFTITDTLVTLPGKCPPGQQCAS